MSLFYQIFSFMPSEENCPHSRTLLALACTSKLTRSIILRTRELVIGCCSMNIGEDGCLSIVVSPSADTGAVVLYCCAYRARIRAKNVNYNVLAQVIRAVSLSPSRTKIIEVKTKHDYEPDDISASHVICDWHEHFAIMARSVEKLDLDFFPAQGFLADVEFPNLYMVVLENFWGDELGLENLPKKCPQLETLQLCNYKQFGPESLTNVIPETLAKLYLDNTNVTPEHMDSLKCNETLLCLSLIDCKMMESVNIGRFCNLTVLLMQRTPIAMNALLGIQECHNLQVLNMGGCRSVTDVNALGTLRYLKKLFLYETSLTNEGIVGLSNCINLEELNLGGCTSITDINCLGKLNHLEELHLWHTRVTNSGISQLRGCVSLLELVLDGCHKISDVSPLARLRNLRWLSLAETNVDSNDIKDLISCTELESLVLSGTKVVCTKKLWQKADVNEFLLTVQ